MAYSGFFTPTHPEKWIITKNGLGGGKIKYRSSWELKFAKWADRHPSIIRVASEEVIVPYRSPIDGRVHRYFLDFFIELKDKNDNIRQIIIEVKPNKETKPPRQKIMR